MELQEAKSPDHTCNDNQVAQETKNETGKKDGPPVEPLINQMIHFPHTPSRQVGGQYRHHEQVPVFRHARERTHLAIEQIREEHQSKCCPHSGNEHIFSNEGGDSDLS